ncbi:ribonuclease HII [Bifidobacterium amazonense]|uniref:Ribonuclease n=1 Tax=Bifidobacterium amazonense TaxID=2809027 RepID=A0ABS9VTJ0_9BIFI|nr:ribonuclease HII [Bifidobacterium amazonense]MCH9275398.1 ribonuclease HII [Bifidobacterium amazonense]
MSIQEVPTLRLERELADGGAELIVGFDEVGRGSLAGPVMVGAAMIRACDLPSLAVPDGVADSKMLTERRREAIVDELKSWCAAWAVGSASNAEIDEWGISHALGVAALRALAEAERRLGLDGTDADRTDAAVRVAGILDGPNDYITKTLDTFDAPDVPAPARITTLVKADRHCATVATAAVIAKVTRDRLMVELAHAHPEWAPYEWEHNKGYGSAAHRAAIAELGPTPLHRVSWKLT